jgi:putative Mg2+ transporter-C (MgtC) family protein
VIAEHTAGFPVIFVRPAHWNLVMGMSAQIDWMDIAIRLGLTLLAGLIIGFDRSEHGKVAGLRTTVLVGLAASLAMIQVNLLLSTAGRSTDSFVTMDIMRLPLGILTGVGFILAGTILRRDEVVLGVTTAATLWLVTVVGLCLGGGQIALGVAGTVLGVVVLNVLKWIEAVIPSERGATITVVLDAAGPTEDDLRSKLREAGLRVTASRISLAKSSQQRELAFDVKLTAPLLESESPGLIKVLAGQSGVTKVQWQSRA